MIEVQEHTKTAWFGEFPAYWDVLRIKNLFKEMDIRSGTGSEELLFSQNRSSVAATTLLLRERLYRKWKNTQITAPTN